jgi:geranylgeranyl pyrophosphate synthase
VVENKSMPFYACAFHLGALFAEVPMETARDIKRLGELYGAMIQIHDDLHDTMEIPANPDWMEARAPLPILFAKTVDHPEREKFMRLCRNISADGALAEAQEILIRCGAVSYCVDQLLRRHQTAQALLDELTLPSKGTLESLIHDLVAPINRLFETLGIQPAIAIGSPE